MVQRLEAKRPVFLNVNVCFGKVIMTKKKLDNIRLRVKQQHVSEVIN